MVLIYKSNIWETPKYNDYYIEILEHNRVPYLISNLDDPEFWENVKKCDYFIYRFVNTEYQIQEAEAIFNVIENDLKKKVFPNFNSRWHFDDKIKQFYLLDALGFPVIESNIYWNLNSALNGLGQLEFPAIFKLKNGAGSSNVVKVDTRSSAKKIIKKIFRQGINNKKIPLGNNLTFSSLKQFFKTLFYSKYAEHKYGVSKLFWNKEMNYALFQKFLPDNKFDIRVTIIGNNAYAFLRYNRVNDFRASGSGFIEYDQNKIDKEAIRLAFEVSDTCGFDSMAYDFLYDENMQLKICEISYTYLDEALFNCPGVYDRNLTYIPGNVHPSFLHIKNLLGNENLKYPPFKKNVSESN